MGTLDIEDLEKDLRLDDTARRQLRGGSLKASTEQTLRQATQFRRTPEATGTPFAWLRRQHEEAR